MRAVTVMGEVEAGELGVTLPHEHLNVDGRFLCTDKSLPDRPITEFTREEVRRHPMRFLNNLDMRDEEVARSELLLFSGAGGRTLVDVTPDMTGSRDPLLLRRLAQSTGVNVIMACGWYVDAAHPERLSGATPEEMAAALVTEIETGVGDTGIKPGVIGEIGTGDPMTAREARVVTAAGLAHVQTGCPVNVHMAAGCREVHRVLDVLGAAGVRDFGRVVISHMDVQIDLPQQREVIQRGAMVEYDTFGHENYPDSRGYVMPTDRSRLEALGTLISEGHVGSLLASHDVCLRSLWAAYGGKGYANLLTSGRRQAPECGIAPDAFETLLVDNPSRVFGFRP